MASGQRTYNDVLVQALADAQAVIGERNTEIAALQAHAAGLETQRAILAEQVAELTDKVEVLIAVAPDEPAPDAGDQS